jgi:hypothetical protein
MVLPDAVLSPKLPILRCRVVYLGAMRNKSVALPGQIYVEYVEDPDGPVERRDPETGEPRRYAELKDAVDTGISTYDFSSHDQRGRLIRVRQAPDHLPSEVRGKPYVWCEHIGHLRYFHLARGPGGEREFHVMLTPEQLPILQDYIRRTARARRQQQAFYDQVAGV